MTAFQGFIEMPITRLEKSYAPADFAARVLPVNPTTEQDRQRLNWATHFALGGMWGLAHGIAASRGCAGRKRSTPCTRSCTPAMSSSTPP